MHSASRPVPGAGLSNASTLGVKSVPEFVEELRRHPFGLPQVRAAEEIQVIEYMVEVVERLALLVADVQRRRTPVRGVEAVREAAEQLGHRQVGFTVADVDRGVEDRRRAVGEFADVAVPEVAMKQGGGRPVLEEESGALVADSLAMFLQLAAEALARRQFELRPQP